MTYTEVFGGGTINPAQRSYLSLVTAIDVTLNWPTNTVATEDVAADIIDVDATQPGVDISLSDARQVSNGFTSLFVNVGSQNFQVLDSLGATIVSPAPGTAWFIYLTDNSTEDGTWATFQLGATVSVADAAALAGAGIKAISATLNQSILPTLTGSTPITWSDANRALFTIWTGGVGVLDLPTPVSVGSDWFGIVRNEGTGILTLTPAGAETIDGAATLVMNPGESAFIITDGSDWFSVGLGSSSTVGFDYVSIDVSGSGDFILSGVQLDRISYNFIGLLTGNRKIIVPNTLQQYWVDNSTTGAFSFEVATAAQVTPIQLVSNNRAILYCDGNDVIDAETGTFTPPIGIGQGGTGATTADGAMDNLGVGRDVLTPALGGLAGGGDLSADRNLLLDVDNLTVELVIDASADVFAFFDDSAAAMRKAPLNLIGSITIEDEGVPLATGASILDFVGAGVVATGAGAEKTITIDQIPASGATGRLLKGDGSGGWVDALANINIEANGDLKMNNGGSVILSSGADRVDFFVSGSACNINSSGGTISHFTTDEDWRFGGSIFINESSVPAAQIGTFGQIWVEDSIFGANPNRLQFEDDNGNNYQISGVQRQATLADAAKSGDTSFSSLLVNFHVQPQRRYKGRGVIWYTQAGGDIKLIATYDQTPEEVGIITWQAQDGAGVFEAEVIISAFSQITVTTMTNSQVSCIQFEFSFQSHDTLSGILDIDWAQNSAVSTTTILEPSWFELVENHNQS